MKNTFLNFDNIDWHDAVIQDINITDLDNDQTNITIKCKIYLSNNDSERTGIQIIFEKIKRNAILFDSHELTKNANAGNINFCYIYNNTYQFSLFGGYIEIKSKTSPKVKKNNECQ
jgi:hypothetical protein